MEDTRLGAILIESRIIREEDLERCLEIQALAGGNRPLGQILVEEALLDQATLQNLLRIQQTRRQRELGSLPIQPEPARGFLESAVAAGANELHLSEGRMPLARVAGDLVTLDPERLAGPEVWQFVREHMGPHMLEDIADRQSVTKEFALQDLARGRITVFRHTDGIGVNVRIHPWAVRPLAETGIDGAVADTLAACKGMILLTGESGSGLTETFASLLHATAAHGKRSILVLDDCIEYPEPPGDARVCIRRVGVHTTDYAAGLRAAMRQNPDAVFLGDAAGPEAFNLALNAAESGKLVVAIAHGVSTTAVLKHCVQMFPRYAQSRVRSILASVVRCVISQRLVPTQVQRRFVSATEMLRFDEAVREVVRSGSIDNLNLLLRLGGQNAGHTMDASLLRMLEDDVATFDDVFPHATDKAMFLRTIGKGEMVHG